jgi:hypothetical protein
MESKRGFKPSQYLRISQDHLVALSLWFLMEDKKQASFENLVAEAFSCFPDRFQLEGYPEWPNAQVVNRAWVRCRTDKKWITGSASEGFSLTPLGENVATKTLKASKRALKFLAGFEFVPDSYRALVAEREALNCAYRLTVRPGFR